MDDIPIWLVFVGVILAFLALAQCQKPSQGDNCYDMDPTQWTEIVCDYDYDNG